MTKVVHSFCRAPRALFPRHVRTPVTHTPAPARDRTLPTTTASQLGSCPVRTSSGKIAKSSIIIGLDGAVALTPRLCYCTGSRPPTYLRVYNRRNSRAPRLHGSPMAINGGCRSILPEVQIGQIWWILTDPRPLEVNA